MIISTVWEKLFIPPPQPIYQPTSHNQSKSKYQTSSILIDEIESEKKEPTKKYRNKKIQKDIHHFIYFTRPHTRNILIINTYNIVHFCYTRMYNIIWQECTILHGKSVQSIVRWLFSLRTELEWTDEPVLVALNTMSWWD